MPNGTDNTKNGGHIAMNAKSSLVQIPLLKITTASFIGIIRFLHHKINFRAKLMSPVEVAYRLYYSLGKSEELIIDIQKL